MSVIIKLCLAAALATIAIAEVPDTCIKSTIDDLVTDDARGTPVDIGPTVGSIAKTGTRFAGLQACVENTEDGERTGRLISVQFYLQDPDAPDDLLEMERIGPEVPDEISNCYRRKLYTPDPNFFIDRAIVYTTDFGIEGIRFEAQLTEDRRVGETFGVEAEGADITTVDFTLENQLVSIAGVQSYTGIMSLTLSSLDTQCIAETTAAVEQQQRIDQAAQELIAENETDVLRNYDTTMVICISMFLVILVLALILCFCVNKDQVERMKKTFLTPEQLEEAKRKSFYPEIPTDEEKQKLRKQVFRNNDDEDDQNQAKQDQSNGSQAQYSDPEGMGGVGDLAVSGHQAQIHQRQK